MLHILNDIVYESPKEIPLQNGACEQLGMFDALGLMPNESDLLIWEADFDDNSIRVYDKTERLTTTFPISELEMRISPDDIKKLRAHTDAFASGLRQVLDEKIVININGAWNTYQVKGMLGCVLGKKFASGVAFDIGAVNRQHQRLQFLETHDPLTGLLNFSSFESKFEKLARFGMYPLSLIIFRIENLCDACGTLGYHAGNTLIRNVADVIKDCFFDADIIGRTGGGEYGCVFSGKSQLEIETRIDEAILKLHSTYLNLIKTQFSCGYSIAESEMDFSRMYHEAYQKLMKKRNLQKHLACASVLDNINAIISRKTGWGKRVLRLQSLSVQIGKALFCKEETLSDIKLLAKIADIGLIGIDDKLLANRLCLNEDEKLVYDCHYEAGRDIIGGIDSLSQMECLYADLYKRYDEWQDAICVPSRIVAVVRGFDDLMLHDNRMTYKEMCKKMDAYKGSLYAPEIVDVLLEVARKYHTWPVNSRKH